MTAESPRDRLPVLLARVSDRVCALPLGLVVEVMRPLRVEASAEGPACVQGWTVLRGERVPVVDLAALAGETPGRATRFISVREGATRAALAVDAVLGVRALSAEVHAALPLALIPAPPGGPALDPLLDRLVALTRLMPPEPRP